LPDNQPDSLLHDTNGTPVNTQAEVPTPATADARTAKGRKPDSGGTTVAAPPLPLHDRIRKETDAFEFNALIGGVSTLDKAVAKPTQDQAPPRRKTGNGWLAIVGAAVVLLAGTVIGKQLIARDATGKGAPGQTQQPRAAVQAPPVADQPLYKSPSEYAKKGLPDPKLTPGERGPVGAESDKVSAEVEAKVFASYGLDPNDGRYVLNRLIPRTLDGTANAANLYPSTPWFRDLKKRLDKKLTQLVRSNQLTVKQAEADLRENWVMAVHKHYVRNYGAGDQQKAKEIEETVPWSQRPQLQ
jgi:hypothetical protein